MNQQKLGLIYGLAAFILWGTLPIYWKALGSISAGSITAHRIAWSALSLVIIIALRGRMSYFLAQWKNPKQIIFSLFTGLLLITNWLIYIWATNNDLVVEISLGYYILPILFFVFGYFILGEHLNKLQICAIILAAAGVTVQGIGIGSLPWSAIGVACSFSIYGVLKKKMGIDGLSPLAMEMIVLSPFAIAFLCQQHLSGANIWGDGKTITYTLLLLSGITTAAPILFFTAATKRIPLSTVGMIQFIAPTGQFLIGWLYYKEALNELQVVSFALIWLAVSIYSYSKTKKSNA